MGEEKWRRSWRLLLTAILLCLVVGMAMGERQPLAQEVPRRPNILFILTDDQNASTLKHMPEVQGELVAKGRTFENAIHTYPLCCPGRATNLTGLYPHNHHVLENGGGYATFKAGGFTRDNVATWVDAQGYFTGYFGKYLNQTPTRAPMQGWDETLAWGDNVDGEVQLVGGGGFPPEENDRRVADAALSLMDEGLSSDEPFFAFAVFAAPHQPFYHPSAYDSMFEGVRAPRKGGAFNEHDGRTSPATSSALPSAMPIMLMSATETPCGAWWMWTNSWDTQWRS